MKVSDHFELQEFIDPVTFEKMGEKSIDLIDKRLIDIAEWIRVDLGLPVTINNWNRGGEYHESGLRVKNTPTGSKKSAHKLGLAIDPKVSGMDGQEWYDYVVKNAAKLYSLGLRRIEDKKIATGWCHMDTKEHNEKNTIQIVDLTKVVERIKF